MISYGTGLHGFLGKHLANTLGNDLVAIAHDKIVTQRLSPFHNFYYLAAYGQHHAAQQDDAMLLKANVAEPYKMLLQAIKFDFNSFVFVSTSSVKLKSQIMYSRTKRATEEIMLAFLEKYNKPIIIVRPYSITGVGEQAEHLIPTLIRSCLKGEKMDFVPDATHDFIDVTDVVNGIINLAEHRAHGVYELGSGIKTTNAEVLALVEKTTGKKANITQVGSLRPYDNTEWVSTNFRSRSYGWLPKVTLEQSIQAMVKEALRTL